jgi:xanthine dehydrogenase YagT iron-sulfur-binding subunit
LPSDERIWDDESAASPGAFYRKPHALAKARRLMIWSRPADVKSGCHDRSMPTIVNCKMKTRTGSDLMTTVHLDINGREHELSLDPRVTLLDALREHLCLTGTKKGCDQGQCGACTVHVDGERVLSCLTLAAQAEGRKVTTIEGLAAENGDLHPVQAAFLEHDAFQCGYCTPGQIMSAVACIREGHAGSDNEIREYMAGNLCRCGAYPHIVAAVREAAEAAR